MTMNNEPTTRERITKLLERCDGLTVRQISFILNENVDEDKRTPNTTIYASLKRNRRFKKQKIVNDSNVRMYSLDKCIPAQSREKIVDWYDFLCDLGLSPYEHPYRDYCKSLNYLINHCQKENNKQWLKRFLSATKEAEKNLGKGNGQNHNLYNLKQLDGRLFHVANQEGGTRYHVYYRDKPGYKATDYKKRMDLADKIAMDLGVNITIWIYGENCAKTVRLISPNCKKDPTRGDWNYGMSMIAEIYYVQMNTNGQGDKIL